MRKKQPREFWKLFKGKRQTETGQDAPNSNFDRYFRSLSRRKPLLRVPTLTISYIILIILTEMKLSFAKSMNQLHARRHRDV